MPQFHGRQYLWLLIFAALLWGLSSLLGHVQPPKTTPTPSQSISKSAPVAAPKPGTNTTGLPLTLPTGFSIATFTDGLERPRVLIFDTNGTLLVSDQKAGTVVALPDADHNGSADQHINVADHLTNPHGLLFLSPTDLVIAEEQRLGLWRYNPATMTAEFTKELLKLPTNGEHVTRTIQQGHDSKLYVTVGSSCNICTESDDHRAAMLRLNPDGSNVERWAWGLRNTVFFIENPKTKDWWGNDMGRDNLGDNLPPDELNRISIDSSTPPGDYGWPNCYGDRQPDPFGGLSIACETKTNASFYNYPAHAAPLGLRFIPAGVGWPKDWESDLLVSFHGSWNRSKKIGYQVMRLHLKPNQTVDSINDFLTGFLQGESDADILGRPVDLLFASDGSLFLSDDGGGKIFRISPPKN